MSKNEKPYAKQLYPSLIVDADLFWGKQTHYKQKRFWGFCNKNEQKKLKVEFQKLNLTQPDWNMEGAGEPRPTVQELQSLTVVKLRQRLAQHGIPQSGREIWVLLLPNFESI